MPATSNCNPCCTDPVVTNVPGNQGDPGDDGDNGLNAYTITTTATTVPAIGDPVTVGYTGDVAAATVIAIGATVSAAGLETVVALEYESAYGSGVVYTLTNSTAYLAVGTNPPTITLPSTGTWLLTATAIVNMVAWLSTVKTVTAKLRNTTAAADLTPIASFALPDTIGAAVTADAGTLVIVGAITAGTAGDIIQLWGNRSAAASTSGDVTITATSITAVRIA